MKKSNVFIYALEDKVIFPYHEYTFTIGSNVYNRINYSMFSLNLW